MLAIINKISSTYCVPDLQLDDFLVNQEAIRSELDTDCNLVLLLELVVHDSLHQTRLADTSISDNDQLKQVVLGSKRLVMNDLKRHLFYLVDIILVHLFIFFLN